MVDLNLRRAVLEDLNWIGMISDTDESRLMWHHPGCTVKHLPYEAVGCKTNDMPKCCLDGPAFESDPGLAINTLDDVCKELNKGGKLRSEIYACVQIFSDVYSVMLIERDSGDMIVNVEGKTIAEACCCAIIEAVEKSHQ